MQKWTQGVDAMHHGVEVSRLDAMDHGAEVLDAANVDSNVALKKKSSTPQITAPRYWDKIPPPPEAASFSSSARPRPPATLPGRRCAPAAAAPGRPAPPSRCARRLRLLPPVLPPAGRGPCPRPRPAAAPGRPRRCFGQVIFFSFPSCIIV